MKKRLSQSTVEKLSYYVYALIDPRNNKVFYVGKGQSNRIYAHVLASEAIEAKVEAALIDYIETVQRVNLTNIMSGHHSNEVGIRTIEDIEIQYEAPQAEFATPMLLIRVNRLYKPGIKPKQLYEATRKSWRVGPRAFGMEYACAVYLGIIREVYEIKRWEPTEVINGHQRHGFIGKVAPAEVRDAYRHTSVKHLFKQGHQSSIVYAGPK